MKKPNFFIVGQPKAGTTSLYNYLKQHPNVFLSEHKEPCYFSKDSTHRGEIKYKNLSRYLELFENASNEKVVGEASTDYISSERAIKEIKKFNPNSKIIIMLRNPVEFISSLHNHMYHTSRYENKKLSVALKKEKKRLNRMNKKSSIDKLEELICYRKALRRMYKNIGEIIKEFGRDNVKIILFENLKDNPDKVYRETCNFLNINEKFKPDFKVHNKGITNTKLEEIRVKVRDCFPSIYYFLKSLIPERMRKRIKSLVIVRNGKRQISQDLAKKLKKEFEEDIIELEKTINKDLSHWK